MTFEPSRGQRKMPAAFRCTQPQRFHFRGVPTTHIRLTDLFRQLYHQDLVRRQEQQESARQQEADWLRQQYPQDFQE
ncbi:MAG: hypothetical protein QHH05_00655 [Syntrophomonadaceae bacterium]|nr:hypothetical protein [Syntrophomonadaceae bacterium]MDH7496947.1 hypothetical protein [Syntrophomonadaceae bacterium]